MASFAGVGSRGTPRGIMEMMELIAYALGAQGYICNSGGAPGADGAFQRGAERAWRDYRTTNRIFLPWPNFNGNRSRWCIPPEEAFAIASEIHPAWNYLTESIKRLMARNSQQVLGPELNEKVDFLVCWTPDGCISAATRTKKTGGTGQAISLASKHGIPVFNLQNCAHFEYFQEYLKSQDVPFTKDYFEANYIDPNDIVQPLKKPYAGPKRQFSPQ